MYLNHSNELMIRNNLFLGILTNPTLEIKHEKTNSHDDLEIKVLCNNTFIGYVLKLDKKDLIEDTFVGIAYTKLSAKDENNMDLQRRAKDSVKFGVDYYGIDKFQFNVNGQYIGDRYNSLNKTGVETGNYTVWNSVINYEINKTFSTYLKVDNLFNKYYQTVDGYATAERSAYAGLKASF